MTVSGYPLSQAHRLMAFAVRQLGGQSVGFCQILYRLDLTGRTFELNQQDYQWGWCDEDQLHQIRDHPEARRASVYDRRLEKGDRCFGLARSGQVLCSNWVSFDRASALVGQDPEIQFRTLEDQECFTYDFYTPRAYRGRGLGSVTKRALLSTLEQEGIGQIYSLVDPRNAPSTLVHLRLGYVPSDEVYLYRFAGNCYAFQRPVGKNVRQWLEGSTGNRGPRPLSSLVKIPWHAPTQVYDLGTSLLAEDLLASAQQCIHYQKQAAAQRFEAFQPDANAAEAVSEAALNRLLTRGLDVHGIATDRSISNVIPFNTAKYEDAVSDQQLRDLRKQIDDRIGGVIRQLFASTPGKISLIQSGHFWYPAGSFMSWHTNGRVPGWRAYLSFTEEPGQSFFRYRDPQTGDIVTLQDSGWDLRIFKLDSENPLWHAVYSNTNRFSFGYMLTSASLTERIKGRLRRTLSRT